MLVTHHDYFALLEFINFVSKTMAVIDKGIISWNSAELEVSYQSLLGNKKILLTHLTLMAILWWNKI